LENLSIVIAATNEDFTIQYSPISFQALERIDGIIITDLRLEKQSGAKTFLEAWIQLKLYALARSYYF
jgi:hypothetical protein